MINYRVKSLFPILGLILISLMLNGNQPLWAATKLTPDEAKKQLEEGNKRFVSGNYRHPNLDKQRMAETAEKGQDPFATVLSCSDSRVPVEIIFDQGIGDVFIVRVAGNVCDVDETGSIEYGVDHLETPVLLVLGHSNCGAVTAVATDAELHGSIPSLVDNIKPAVEKAKIENPTLSGKELVPAAVKANVWQAIEDLLKGSPGLRERAEEGKVKIIGAVYHLEDGHVEWLGSHPEEKKLFAQ
jgi:carbonic anhydrase